MTVNELIAALQKVKNKDMDVLVSDHDSNFYDIGSALVVKVTEGREDEENGEAVIVLG
jgi:ABC-type polar amino acid transport system ATPase subunit